MLILYGVSVLRHKKHDFPTIFSLRSFSPKYVLNNDINQKEESLQGLV